MVHRMPMDAGYVMTRNSDSLLSPQVAPALGVDLDLFNLLDQRQRQLGYRHGRTSLTPAIARLLLWRGDPDMPAITYEDLTAFCGEEMSRWCTLPEAPLIRASHVHSTRRIHDPAVLAPLLEEQCRDQLHALHVLLFDTGQIPSEPMHGLRSDVIWRTRRPVHPGAPPAITAPIRPVALLQAADHRPGRVGARRPGHLPLPADLARRATSQRSPA